MEQMNWIERATQIKNGATIIRDWWGDGLHPIDKEDAKARAKICLKCPMNTRKWSFVNQVALAIKKTMAIKNHLGLRVTGEKQLGTCAVCGCALRLKIWTDRKYLCDDLTPAQMSAYPDYCWMLKL
jgi:hypothetical protein